MKYLLLFLVCLVFFHWVKKKNKAKARVMSDVCVSQAESKILPCQICGVFSPEANCVMVAGKSYCSQAHADVGMGNGK